MVFAPPPWAAYGERVGILSMSHHRKQRARLSLQKSEDHTLSSGGEHFRPRSGPIQEKNLNPQIHRALEKMTGTF